MEIPTNPHMFSWTNLLTLIQYFCQLFLFWFHFPLTPVFTYEAALLFEMKMQRSVLKVWSLAAQKVISPQGQSRPGIHEEGVVNLAPPLGGTLSPGHWNSTAYGQRLKKILKIVSAASASNASLSLCSKYAEVEWQLSILLIFTFLPCPCTRNKMKWTPIHVSFSVTKASAFQVRSVDPQGGHPWVP